MAYEDTIHTAVIWYQNERYRALNIFKATPRFITATLARRTRKGRKKGRKKKQSHLKIFSFWETFSRFNNPVSVLYVDVINLK